MIDLNPQVMLLVDGKGDIARANKALLDLMGLESFEDVLQRPLDDVFPGSNIAQHFATAQGGRKTQEAQVMLATGKSAMLQFTLLGTGRKEGLSVVMVRDVSTEQAQAADLEKEHKTEAVTALAGALMHNLNQSLTVIMIQAQLIQVALEKDYAQSGELRNSLQDIVEHTAQIANTLRTVENSKDFVTEQYLEGVDILDIEESGQRPSEPGEPVTNVLNALESSAPDTRKVLLATLCAHDPGARCHSHRVGEGAAILARCIGLSEKEAEAIKRCGNVHDIGKLGIPDALLQKPDSLSDDEMATMSKHSRIGHDILQCFAFSQNDAETALQHHERFDGSGYPQGLAGDDISRRARIVAVADTFDVLRSGRPYCPAVSLEEALGEISKNAGTQFDPEIAKAAVDCADKLGALFA